MNLTESLLHWYSQNKRPLPWRETRDPYKIWLSEVILQQTRVAQGMNYYHRFLVSFPDVHSLAKADEQEVLKLWQGLGYYSRARNMHHAAKEIVEKHNGIFPQSATELRKLKGIGEYTASAIASICYDEPTSVVDGNVSRVLSRFYALETVVDTHAGRSLITGLADSLMGNSNPGTFNQAVMELGALICTPKSPVCSNCPLNFPCEALKQNKTESFPLKTLKKSPRARHMNYLVICFTQNNEEFVMMRKRTGNDIWKNMYDFPCIETESAADVSFVLQLCQEKGILQGLPFTVNQVSEEYIHQLSHRRLFTKFIRIGLDGLPKNTGEMFSVKISEIEELPLPRLIDRYVATLLQLQSNGENK